MSPVDLLQGAAELLGDEARWVRGHFAATPSGEHCGPLDDEAVAWCGVGALYKVIGHYHAPIAACPEPASCPLATVTTAMVQVVKRLYADTIYLPDVNDRLGREAVLNVYAETAAVLGRTRGAS